MQGEDLTEQQEPRERREDGWMLMKTPKNRGGTLRGAVRSAAYGTTEETSAAGQPVGLTSEATARQHPRVSPTGVRDAQPVPVRLA